MNRKPSILDGLRVASPCAASWERMQGDERSRFCSLCGLNVYNLSAMTRPEAEALAARREGRLCVRFFKRADGTVLTQDCPVGLRALRRRLALFACALAGLIGYAVLAAASWRPGCARRGEPLRLTELPWREVEPFKTWIEWLDPAPKAPPYPWHLRGPVVMGGIGPGMMPPP